LAAVTGGPAIRYQAALKRVDAFKLLTELRDVQARLDRLKDGLRRLVEEDRAD
jgi:hypothetical protein